MIKNGYAFGIDDPSFSEAVDKALRNIGDIMDHWAIVRDTEKEQKERKEENMFDFGNMFNGMFKPVAKGYCKMGANGKIAIKVQNGYKTFNVKTNSKGLGVFKITNLKKKGIYIAVITVPTNKYYNKISKKMKIAVKS